MSNSYRIRTQVGVDKSIKVLIDQEFEYLEILSLKVLQSQIYTRQCSDYGVVIGRITANDGFGIPNAKISIFIPLTDEDSNNPIISDLYPYKTLSELNADGYRYNLLPYKQSYSNHTPTGTFFTKNDVLVDPTLIEVYDKYFKYTAKTNDSGDFMIFGVPTGPQTIHVDIDLSDIGEFSLSPQDLVRMGIATETQVAGTKFKASNNLNSLPQIISLNRVIEVEPLWGQPEICNLGITRTDFDLTDEVNLTITPTSIFMGSIFSSNDDQFQKRNCKPKLKQGKLCNLVTGPGEILAIRQTIQQDSAGQPILETVDLENGGQVIDENGTWLVDVPMNLDYVITNEFGERVLSNDPKKGIPTKGKYRFKVKWNQSPSLSESVKRGYFLVPNVREYGWQTSNVDPLKLAPTNPNYQEAIKSYAFSLDWNDYADPQSAINCDDTFYEMKYNKVYTVSQLIDQYRRGYLPNRMITVKDILDESCESENVKFPTNDSIIRFDIIYLLFVMMMFIFKPTIYLLLVTVHVLAFFLMLIGPILAVLVGVVMELVFVICEFINGIIWAINLIPGVNINGLNCPSQESIANAVLNCLTLYKKFTHLNLPNLSYPDCELCSCKEGELVDDTTSTDPSTSGLYDGLSNTGINSLLSQYQTSTSYNVGGATYPSAFQLIMGGAPINSTSPTATSRVPQLMTYGNDGTADRHLFSSSLTLSERINLFNNKSKYFDDFGGLNPGGGFNRIKVTFDTSLNNPSVKYHYDNVVMISCQPNQLSNFQTGQIVSFQDTRLSNDVNLTGYTLTNQFGTNSITGTSINDTGTITVNYSNPSTPTGLPLLTTTYGITQNPDEASYAKFPMDVEYFQVITAMTYNNFSGLTNPMGSNLSLNKRYLNNDMIFTYLSSDNCVGQLTPIVIPMNPLHLYTDGPSQVLVFLVRGVDPYSTRKTNSYDLSVLFGYNFGQPGLTVTGEFKLNHPIKGGLGSVRHDMTSNIMSIDPSTSEYLYYESFHFQPETNPSNAGFSSFTSNLPSFYSKLDSSTYGFTPLGGVGMSIACDNGPFNVASVKTLSSNPLSSVAQNGFTIEWDGTTSLAGCGPNDLYFNWSTNTYSSDNRGYFEKEIVEGGSVMLQRVQVTPESTLYNTAYYYAPRYPATTTYTYSNLGTNNRQIIMRSDRLPLSTSVQETAYNSFALQSNSLFSAFLISDDGTVADVGGTSSNSPSVAEAGESQEEGLQTFSNNVVASFSCGQMVPLSCYYDSSGEIAIEPTGDNCYENGVTGAEIMKNGCYITVTAIFLSLPKDIKLLTEWTSRLQITFGACRDVWSHIFTNNWINGALYAFSFKNDRFYDSQNVPSSYYCKDTLILHPTTNNFYYRSSPWTGNGFIGANAPNGLFGPDGGNHKNLKFPTTIMDLGPRSVYQQEIVMSDDYDGYVVNKLRPTTFTDVSEILNLFIISRLTNTSFLGQMLGVGGSNILSYFNQRGKRFVDADYAQMLSISSELGISDFEPANYPPIVGAQDPIYFNGASSSDGVFGIFFSSDTQVRDYISPKRTIINGNTVATNPCAFNYFSVFTQSVPFYQWEINQGNPDSIFGSQSNDWYTTPINGVNFFTHKYQEMDRLDINSRYFRTNGSTLTKDYKGYIYSVDGIGNYNPNPTSQNPNNPLPRVITVGAPFHFYFGLKKGKTAFDRFATKWISFETIVD